MRFINHGFHNAPDMGYGNMGIDLDAALTRAGVVNLGGIHHVPDGENGWYNPKDEITGCAPVAFWCSTPPHVRGWFEGQCSVLASMWEYTEMPSAFRENLSYLDRLLVPSEQNVELFSRFHDDVHYVPLAVGPEWAPVDRPEVESEFRFLCAGFGSRKNNGMIVRAFREVFGNLITNPGKHPQPKLIMRAKDAVQSKGVVPITSSLPEDDLIALYASAHCFVCTSRGEGWGLLPHQAIRQGCPTILPDAHGCHSFADLGIPLSAREVPCGDVTSWGDSGCWWEPDYQQLCAAMWDVYNNYEAHVDRAVGSAVEIERRFNWDDIAQRIIQLVPEMGDPLIENPVWMGCPRRLWSAMVTEKIIYNINGKRYEYHPGVEYAVTADLRERLRNKGILHPDFRNPFDPGFIAEEVLV